MLIFAFWIWIKWKGKSWVCRFFVAPNFEQSKENISKNIYELITLPHLYTRTWGLHVFGNFALFIATFLPLFYSFLFNPFLPITVENLSCLRQVIKNKIWILEYPVQAFTDRTHRWFIHLQRPNKTRNRQPLKIRNRETDRAL